MSAPGRCQAACQELYPWTLHASVCMCRIVQDVYQHASGRGQAVLGVRLRLMLLFGGRQEDDEDEPPPKKGLFGGFGTQRVRAEPKAEPASTSPLKSLFGGKARPREACQCSDSKPGCWARCFDMARAHHVPQSFCSVGEACITP